MRTLDPAHVAAFGKLARASDFVRSAPVGWGVALQRFLADGHQLAQGRLVPEPVFFVAQLGGLPELQCGAWVPSQDAVGRKFPLGASIALDPVFMEASAWALPVALQPFFDALVQALDAGTQGDLAALAQSFRSVATPHPLWLRGAAERCAHALRDDTVGDFAERVFGSGQGTQFAYAVRAIDLAVAEAFAPAGSPLVLDCPIAEDIDVVVWGELVQRVAGRDERAFGLFWTERSPRLILSLGAAEPAILAFLADPSRAGGSLWPLHTSRPEALVRARDELSPRLKDAIARDRPLLELVSMERG